MNTSAAPPSGAADGDLPAPLRELAAAELDGAVLERVLLDRRIHRLVLFLRRTAGGADGSIELVYHRADTETLPVERLAALAAERGATVAAHSLARRGDTFEHRLVFRPEVDVTVAFAEAALVARPS